MKDLNALYEVRFDPKERAMKERIWKVLVGDFFQRYVAEDATVLDLACGFGEFSRYIRAARKLAVDANPQARELGAPEGEFVHGSADDLGAIDSSSVDVTFTSNFFEHLDSKETLDQVLAEVMRVLKPGGRFIALQPNIRYAYARYWDYYDHVLPLSHVSAQEGFEKNGYVVEELMR